jgi:hypothetical protein
MSSGFDFSKLKPLRPEPGKIRFLTGLANYSSLNWIHNSLFYRDRSIREWIDYLGELSQVPNFGPQVSIFVLPSERAWNPDNPFPDPWLHRPQAAEFMYSFLMHNMRLRWLARKFVARIRARIMSKRIVGADADVASGDPIPDTDAIRVRDIATRRTYVFHMSTMHTLLLGSLRFHCYGFSEPQHPTNPYTNIPWNIGQMISIFNQVCARRLENGHRMPHELLIGFRNAGYVIEKFKHNFSSQLQLFAAKQFFMDTSSPEFLRVFEETVLDILEDIDMPKDGRVYDHVSARSVLPRLLLEWDDMAATYWIYYHFATVMHDRWRNYTDLNRAAADLYQRTLQSLRRDAISHPSQFHSPNAWYGWGTQTQRRLDPYGPFFDRLMTAAPAGGSNENPL